MPIRFTRDQVNRFLIHKQGLAPASQADLRDTALPTLLGRIGVLRAGAPSTPYLSLWARSRAFERELLDDALCHTRSLLRIPAMHARWFIVPTAAYPSYYGATYDNAQDALEGLDALLQEGAPHDATATRPSEEMARRVLEVLSASEPLTIDQLCEWLPRLEEHVYHHPEQPELGYSRWGTRLIPAMCARGLLVRAQPAGGWRSTQFRYASLSAWAPSVTLGMIERREALRTVILDTIRAFGPITIGDLSQWLGGIKRREVSGAVMALGSQVRHVQVMEAGGDYLLVASDLDALTEPQNEMGVIMLPPGDSLLSAYSDLSRFVPAVYASRLTDRVGEAYGTIWRDAQIVGTWGIRSREERVFVRFFESVSPQLWATVGEKARAMARTLDMDASLDMQVERADEDTSGPGQTHEPLRDPEIALPLR